VPLYTVRGHLVAQLGLGSITPFVLVGAGGLGVASPREVLGNDIDPALHFGGGLKFYLNRWVMLRLDVRDIVSYKQGVDEVFESHNLEALLGLGFTFGRKKDKDAPRDRDGDGYWDTRDACPDEAGVAPDGCPIPDTDGDGFLDPDDSCIPDPETRNGYLDSDGCPDEVPREVTRFVGVIKGITFDTDEATIRRSSLPILDEAVKVLSEYKDIRIEIAGHTDDTGERDHNLDLSKRRAEAVKKYLVDNGIDEGRIVTTGYGPDRPLEPIADGDTKATKKKKRANNRRTEFTIVTGTDRAGGTTPEGGTEPERGTTPEG
jgi:OOP family OmpA-OmpF porin